MIRRAAICSLVVASATWLACSASGDGDSTGSGAGTTGAGATGGAPAGSGGGIVVGQGGGTGGMESCASDTYPSELQPLDLYVLLDQSESMDQAGKWGAVLSAVSSFAADPSTADIGMGLALFPRPPEHPPPAACDGSNPNDPACGLYGPCLGSNNCYGALLGDSCLPSDYALPDVAIAPLPGVGQAINDALATASPPAGMSTPSEPAMRGALGYAVDWASAHPDRATVLVFATDGDPTNCTTNSVAGIASHVAAAQPAVKTFVVGVGSSLGNLDTIAVAGGTGEALLVDTAADVTAQFIAAMNGVRAIGQCQLDIPEPAEGTPDYGKVNVAIVDPDDDANRITLANVGSEGECDETSGGWYYDDPASPARIFLCPASCSELTGNAWDVEVLLGCATLVK